MPLLFDTHKCKKSFPKTIAKGHSVRKRRTAAGRTSLHGCFQATLSKMAKKLSNPAQQYKYH